MTQARRGPVSLIMKSINTARQLHPEPVARCGGTAEIIPGISSMHAHFPPLQGWAGAISVHSAYRLHVSAPVGLPLARH